MRRILRPTLQAVADRAGVSAATASRALAGSSIVHPDTIRRVLAAAEALSYLPGGPAQALASGRTHTIGAIIPTLDHAIFARAIQAMQTNLATYGYQLLLAAHEYSAQVEAKSVRSMLGRGVDALMVVGADHLPETWNLLMEAPVPIVLSWSFDDRLDAIGFDNARAGYLAARHLLDLGHRRFGMVSGFTQSNDRARLRIAGVRKALSEAGIDFPQARVSEQPFTLAGGREGLAQLLELVEPPTAIVCGNDLLAVGVLFGASYSGLCVPRDLSVVGIDNLEIASHVAPSLTTVNLPTAELGLEIAEHLLARLRGEFRARHTEMAIALVERSSSGPLVRSQ
ncbi:LacI family DNA-binding transcriptional regulator [Methylobacterium trifolii]|uniref:Catabolite control protein A n=1 Tax=Methylobacterium trifolii TaxID=1003092 RepID=A0ABQ4U2Q7_9HYPH|nr:LacI family DNA-binding transcriptional regulator [Methylobacterium trifolii]GJE61122.1 Catabolite control protein A [Methylobacterium trifolii]